MNRFLLFLFPVCLLTACGGGGGGTGGGATTTPIEPVVTLPCLERESGASQIACLEGTLTPSNVYLGNTPAWSQLIIGSDGSASFQGEESLSFQATDIQRVEDLRATEGHILVEVARAGGSTQEFLLVLHPDGKSVLDIEYWQAGTLHGISVAEVPDWQDNHVGSIGNGVNANFRAQKIQTAIDHAMSEPSYADATGLHVSAIENRGDTDEKGWRIHVANFDPRDFPRDYACQAGSDAIYVALKLEGKEWSTATPGRCVINIAYIEYTDPRDRNSPIDYIDGHFVAELQADTAARPERVLDGIFRFDVN